MFQNNFFEKEFSNAIFLVAATCIAQKAKNNQHQHAHLKGKSLILNDNLTITWTKTSDTLKK